MKFRFKTFANRESGIIAVRTAAVKNWNSYVGESTTKQDFAFVVIAGGSGSGKTRASNEVGNILRSSAHQEHVNAVFKSTCELYIDFSNADMIMDFERTAGPSYVMGLRLFVKALRKEANVSDFKKALGEHSIEQFVKRKLFDPELVLSTISSVYRELLGLQEHETLPFVVILDETQLTINTFPQEKKWKDIFKAMGGYMITNKTKLEAPKLLLIPVISGTLPSRDISFEAVGYGNEYFPLHPFPLSVCIDLAKKEGIAEQYLDSSSEMKRFWYLMGLVPRSLEFAVRQVEQYQSAKNLPLQPFNPEALFTSVMNSLDSLYKLNRPFFSSTTDDPMLLWYAITGKAVPVSEEWISKLECEGLIYLTKNNRLLLPYPVLAKLSQMYTTILPPSCLLMLKDTFHWAHFEKLDLHVLSQRRRKATTVGELFPGAHGHKIVLETTISPSEHCIWALEKEAYLFGQKNNFKCVNATKSIKVVGLHNGIEKSYWCHYVLQATKNHLLVDARFFVNSKHDVPMVFFIQYKYTENPNSEKEDQIKISPSSWYKTLADTVNAKYGGYQVIFVYITNANIPSKAADAIDKHDNLLVIEQSCAETYFSPNMFPYYSTSCGNKDVDSDDE